MQVEKRPDEIPLRQWLGFCCFRALFAIVPIWLVLMLVFKLFYHHYPPLKYLPVFYGSIVVGDLIALAIDRLSKSKSKF